MFAIIILNYKSSNDVIKLVHQIEIIDAKIIVVDNNSPDNSRDDLSKAFFENKNVKIIENNNNDGYAVGNNLGLKAAENMGFKYAFVLNPDVSVESLSVFQSCIDVITATESLACAPLIDNVVPYYSRPRFLDFLLPPLVRLKDKSLDVKMRAHEKYIVDVYKLYGCFICFDIAKFKKIGYFDEKTFLYFEESIVAEKALKNNLRQVNILNLSIRHVAQSSVKQLGVRQFKFFYQSCFIYLNQFRNINFIISMILSLIDVTFRFSINKVRGFRK